jgi:hypothetical protein
MTRSCRCKSIPICRFSISLPGLVIFQVEQTQFAAVAKLLFEVAEAPQDDVQSTGLTNLLYGVLSPTNRIQPVTCLHRKSPAGAYQRSADMTFMPSPFAERLARTGPPAGRPSFSANIAPNGFVTQELIAPRGMGFPGAAVTATPSMITPPNDGSGGGKLRSSDQRS